MINIGSLDVDKIYVGNDEVDKIYVGNDLVWSSAPVEVDEFIMNVTSVLPTGDIEFSGLRFKLKLKSPVTVTFDNETQTFTPQDTGTDGYITVTFNRQSQVTGNLIISGGFTDITFDYLTYGVTSIYPLWEINSVVKWYKNSDLFSKLFFGTSSSFQDISIPSSIHNIYANFDGNSTSYQVTLPNNVDYIEKLGAGFKNDTPVDDVYYKNNIACGYFNDSRTTPVTIANGTTKLAAYLFNSLQATGGYMSNSSLTGINFPNDGVLTEMPDNFMKAGSTAITTLSIPSSINKIGVCAFRDFSRLSNVYIYSSDITLPTAGSDTGAFYYKISTNINVYTDNVNVVNYDWASDNRTPTFYHIDGTPWSS